MVKINQVTQRILYISPTVQAGWENESTQSDFDNTKSLGKGAFGKVYKGVHKVSKMAYAIKEISKNMVVKQKLQGQIQNEVKIMYSLKHPNIIKLLNHFEEENNIYLVIEFAEGGMLYKHLFDQPTRKFNETKTSKYIKQLILALQHLHGKNIIHRDIKPENILLDKEDNVKLADFGWSNYMKPDDTRQTYCGTLDYLAPEMLEKNHQHDFKVDNWSVGVLTYELLTGCSPFVPQIQSPQGESITKDNIKNVNYQFPGYFPALAKDFVKKILVKDPQQRPSLEEMLNHDWLKSVLYSSQEIEKSNAGMAVKKIFTDVKEQKEIFNHFTDDEILSFTTKKSIINNQDNDLKKSSDLKDIPLFFGNPASKQLDKKFDQMNFFEKSKNNLKTDQEIIQELKSQLKNAEDKSVKLSQQNQTTQLELEHNRKMLQNQSQLIQSGNNDDVLAAYKARNSKLVDEKQQLIDQLAKAENKITELELQFKQQKITVMQLESKKDELEFKLSLVKN